MALSHCLAPAYPVVFRRTDCRAGVEVLVTTSVC